MRRIVIDFLTNHGIPEELKPVFDRLRSNIKLISTIEDKMKEIESKHRDEFWALNTALRSKPIGPNEQEFHYKGRTGVYASRQVEVPESSDLDELVPSYQATTSTEPRKRHFTTKWELLRGNDVISEHQQDLEALKKKQHEEISHWSEMHSKEQQRYQNIVQELEDTAYKITPKYARQLQVPNALFRKTLVEHALLQARR